MKLDLALTAALIAVRAQTSTRARAWHPTHVAQFAVFSLGQVGDASIDDDDLKQHVESYRDLARDSQVNLLEEVEGL